MQSPNIIYYGKLDLRAQVLSDYFARLHCLVHIAAGLSDLLASVQTNPNAIVVLCDNRPPSTLVRLAEAVIPDTSQPFPPVFILHDGEWFDPKLPAVTVITGTKKTTDLCHRILVSPAYTGLVPAPLPAAARETDPAEMLSPEEWNYLRANPQALVDADLYRRYLLTLRHNLHALLRQARINRARFNENQYRLGEAQRSSTALRDTYSALKEKTVDTLARSRRVQSARGGMVSIRDYQSASN